MKKLFVLLLALMVAGVFAFAQDAAPALKLSGYLNFGLAYSKTGSNDDMVAQNGDDSATAGRLNINGSYNAGDYGVGFRVREQLTNGFDPSSGANTVFMRRVYGWTKFAGGMVKVQGGKLADYTWVSSGAAYWNCFGNFDGPVGVQVQVMPMDGLNVGLFMPIAKTSAPLTLEDTFKSSAIGGIYTMKDVFQAVGGYWMNIDTAASESNNYLWFGGSLLMVPGLTADMEAKISSSKTPAGVKTGSTFLFEAVYYTMGALKVGAQMSQELFNNSDNKSQIYLGPEASYALDGNTTVGVTTNIALKDGKTGYGVGPYVKLVTAKNSFVKIQAGISGGDWAAGSGLVVFKTPGTWASITDDTTWALVDFVWNF